MSPPILPDDAMSLSSALAWVNRASRGRFNDKMVLSATHHRSRVGTDPSILVHAALVWLALSLDRSADPLNQYWHLVDQVSAQVRSRYWNVPAKELM